MSFESQLASFAAKTRTKMINVIRYSCFDLFSSIVMETPVLKGVLRNNWYAQIGSPYQGSTEHAAPVGTATLNRIKVELQNVDLKDVVFFVNNMPYAIPIEYDGHSGKAPQGMVRVNTARWNVIVSDNVRKYNK